MGLLLCGTVRVFNSVAIIWHDLLGVCDLCLWLAVW